QYVAAVTGAGVAPPIENGCRPPHASSSMAPPLPSSDSPRAMSQPRQYGEPLAVTGIGGSALGPMWKADARLASPAGPSTATCGALMWLAAIVVRAWSTAPAPHRYAAAGPGSGPELMTR